MALTELCNDPVRILRFQDVAQPDLPTQVSPVLNSTK